MADDKNIVEIPRSTLAQARPYSVEAGFSYIKAIYKDKRDVTHNNNEKEPNIRLRSVEYKRGEFEKLTGFLQDNCDGQHDCENIFVTGSKSIQFSQTNTGSKKYTPLRTADCLARAIKFLYDSGGEEAAFYSPSPLATPMVRQAIAGMEAFVEAFKQYSQATYVEPKRGLEELSHLDKQRKLSAVLPCILVVLEGNSRFYYVDQSGKASELDRSQSDFESLRGIVGVITGIKDDHEIISAATAGDNSTIDIMSKDAAQEGVSDMYAVVVQKNFPIYLLGKAAEVSKEKFAKQDIIRSMLRSWCIQITQLAHLLAHAYDCPRVLFCGSMVDEQVVRDLILTEFVTSQFIYQTEVIGQEIDARFCRHGSWLAALGSYISTSAAK